MVCFYVKKSRCNNMYGSTTALMEIGWLLVLGQAILILLQGKNCVYIFRLGVSDTREKRRQHQSVFFHCLRITLSKSKLLLRMDKH